MKVCLRSLALLVEVMDPFANSELPNFFDEILVYIKTFLIHEPKMSVLCIRHLIRNMFLMTYPNWKMDENLYDFNSFERMSLCKAFDYIDKNRSQSPLPQKLNVDITPVHTGSKLINFLVSTSTPEKNKATTDHRNIKRFEPLVIQCLKVRESLKLIYIDIDHLCSFSLRSSPNPTQKCRHTFWTCYAKCCS